MRVTPLGRAAENLKEPLLEASETQDECVILPSARTRCLKGPESRSFFFPHITSFENGRATDRGDRESDPSDGSMTKLEFPISYDRQYISRLVGLRSPRAEEDEMRSGSVD